MSSRKIAPKTASKTVSKPGTKKTRSVDKPRKESPAKFSAEAPAKPQIKPEIRREITAIALFAAAVLLFIGLLVSDGDAFLGGTVKGILLGLFGFGAYLLPFAALLWGIGLLGGKRISPYKLGPKLAMWVGIFLILISFVHMINLEYIGPYESFGDNASWLFQSGSASNGGLLGGMIGNLLQSILSRPGAYVFMTAGFIVLLITVTGRSLFQLLAGLFSKVDKGLSKFARAADENGKRYERNRAGDAEDFDEDHEFEYTPDRKDEYVYETRGKSARGFAPSEFTVFKKEERPYQKPDKRKVFDYMLNNDDEDFDEPEIYLMDASHKQTPKKAGNPPIDGPINGVKSKIVDFRFPEEKDGDSPPWEEKSEKRFDESYGESSEELMDGALAGLGALGESPDPHDWESAISVKGVGIEGYVPKTVTTSHFAEDFVEADVVEDVPDGAAFPEPAPNLTPRQNSELLQALPDDGEEESFGSYSFDSDNSDEDTGDARPYIMPGMELLEKNNYSPSPSSKAQILENSRKLEETLRSFGVEARVVEVSKGPTVTRYELSPGVGVKVSKISNLADDLALNLAALGIRIEAPIPGKSVVGIEIPNSEVQAVLLRDVVEDDAFWSFPSKLSFAVGKDIAGNTVIVDIAKMPHLLIAGATGSGKSVCVNTIITSILFKSTPEEVRMLMIDPKVVELNVYNGIPHLEIPVVTDPQKAAGALSWGVREMNDRYSKFAKTGTRDLKGYNAALVEAGEKPMPQIVIIIDELADLMMSCKADVEQNICRLAQKARAAGIHLIIATQRPSVDVITGLIKANIPSRLAFAVTSGTDSRTILDMVGAEKLLGKGDMLFSPAGLSKPQRIQGAFISDKEVERLVTFIKRENGEAVYDPEKVERITASDQNPDEDFDDGGDEFMREAINFVTAKGKASTSMIQREFRLGYNRAARIMEMLEARGIVGPADGAKPRKVLIGSHSFDGSE